MKIFITIIGLMISIIIVSCDETDKQTEVTDFYETEWHLYKYHNTTDDPITITANENEEYSITFITPDSIYAVDACNTCTGNFEMLQNDRINIVGLSCTEMACQGNGWIANISGVYGFNLDGDTLILTSEYSRSDTDQHELYFKAE